MPENASKVILNKYGISSIIREFVMVAFTAFLIWLSAGLQLWFSAWIYIIWLLLFSAVFMAAMARWNPGLLNLRGAPRREMKTRPMPSYEKVFFTGFVILVVLIPIVAGLEFNGFFVAFPFPGFLFTVIQMPSWLVVLGLFFIVFGEILFGWAMVVNPFFHGMMTIQDDRKHQVVSRGPYGWIRHPGYLGQILLYLGTPLFLASWWALLLGLVMTGVFIYRTAKEDSTLRKDLPGYQEYANHIRKRLIPRLW
jgi:protein-S-isoprenylcysteine O-methyltransferase Ste14